MSVKFNIVKTRAVLSSLLLIVFFVVAFTGIGLYFAPSGRVAKEIGWTFFGFPKFKLEKLHTVSAFTMLSLILIHLSLNYKLFVGELRMLLKRS